MKKIFLLIVLFSFCSPLFLSSTSEASDKAVKASDLDIIAGEIVKQLNGITSLDGHIIQISETNFWELETNNNLPFSFHLKEALASALAQYGAKQSIQEIGGEPLRMLGTYAIENEEVRITIRIRKMGLTESQDIVVSEKIPRKYLENEWFVPDFHRIGNTLIRILANNCDDQNTTYNVSVKSLRPGIRGARSLILAQTFKKDIQTSVALSPMFTKASSWDVDASLHGTYEEIGQHIRFHLTLTGDEDDRIISSAIFEIPKKSIPENLLKEVYSTSSIPSIVVIPPHDPASDIDKRFVDQANNFISGFLTSNGYKLTLDKDVADLQLHYKFNIQQREGGKSTFAESSIITLNIRVATADSGNLISEKTGRVPVKYPKGMSQFNKDTKISEALNKTAQAVCKLLSREITSYYIEQR